MEEMWAWRDERTGKLVINWDAIFSTLLAICGFVGVLTVLVALWLLCII